MITVTFSSFKTIETECGGVLKANSSDNYIFSFYQPVRVLIQFFAISGGSKHEDVIKTMRDMLRKR